LKDKVPDSFFDQ
jgi:serine/threonine-protein kinase SRPK3